MKSGPFETEMFVHFDDADPGQIMFFPNYFRFSQRAWELCLAESQVTWKEWYDHPDWGVPLRHVEAEFSRPLRAGQNCQIRQGVERLGNSSVTLRTEIRDTEKHLCSVVTTTHVFIDAKTFKKRAIPPHIREFLESKRI